MTSFWWLLAQVRLEGGSYQRLLLGALSMSCCLEKILGSKDFLRILTIISSDGSTFGPLNPN